MSSDEYSEDGFEDEGKSPAKGGGGAEKYSDDEFEEDFEEENDDGTSCAAEKKEDDGRAAMTSASLASNTTAPDEGSPDGTHGSRYFSGDADGSSFDNFESGGGTQWTHVHPEDIDIGQRIGGGGFAIVYEGRWEGRHVALKTLFDPRVSKELVQEFMDELHVMSSLSHPNVVELFAANTRPPKLVIVMELCDRSLYQLLHRTERPPQKRSRSKKYPQR